MASTLICVPIMVADEASAWREGERARAAGADLVEYRIDEFFSGSGEEAEMLRVVRLVAESPLPCIVTCRPTWEGGGYDGDEDVRISLFERLGTAFGEGERPPRFIDVELAAFTRSANIRQKVKLAVEHPEQVRDLKTSLVLSVHDFGGRPADLSRRVLAMQAEPAAKVLKVAYRARSLRDNLDLFELLAHRQRPMIALGMGEFGLMSRVLAPKFGGFLTFASLRKESVTAPGQPTVQELLDLYRFRQITPATAVYGVVGWPATSSLSPLVHNAGFAAVGHDGVYLPMPVQEGYESLKATVLELLHFDGGGGLTLRGLSVTLPHKEHLVRLAREAGWEVDGVAEGVGAANTVVVDGEGGVRVMNTDVEGVKRPLEEAIGDLRGRRVLVVGAGGVARAAVFALAGAGAEAMIVNRDIRRAERLAEEMRGKQLSGQVRAGGIEQGKLAEPTFPEVIINCTPVGMRGGPAEGESPMLVEGLRSECVVMDTVYVPEITPLLAQARARGLRTISGVSMFVRQAAAQFAAWTGQPAPLEEFERLVREAGAMDAAG